MFLITTKKVIKFGWILKIICEFDAQEEYKKQYNLTDITY